MDYIKRYYELEKRELSKYAFQSKYATRELKEEDSNIRNAFQIDRDRILHSKSFRRLMHKTQVYISPEKDHYRTRLTHTLEVSQIARTIGRALKLNEDLIEAISLGHDLGHTPFGHMGEDVLNELNPKGFKHYEQSVRVVKKLEIKSTGKIGLNLTNQVIDGILNHSKENKANTLEGRVIKFSDRIAYINHDIDNSIRAGILTEEDIPKYLTNLLGNNHGDRINTMVMDLVSNSYGENDVLMSPKIYEATMELRDFMFRYVYKSDLVKQDEERVHSVIENLYNYYKKNFDKIPQSHRNLYKLNKELSSSTIDDIITDYIAGMTDIFARNTYKDIFIPKSWK